MCTIYNELVDVIRQQIQIALENSIVQHGEGGTLTHR